MEESVKHRIKDVISNITRIRRHNQHSLNQISQLFCFMKLHSRILDPSQLLQKFIRNFLNYQIIVLPVNKQLHYVPYQWITEEIRHKCVIGINYLLAQNSTVGISSFIMCTDNFQKFDWPAILDLRTVNLIQC